jgi:calpain, invertebrate
MMGCSVVGDTEKPIVVDGMNTGIRSGHAYGIIDVFEITSNIKKHRLLRVRNPWGEIEWLGKWSDRSPEVEMHMKYLKE